MVADTHPSRMFLAECGACSDLIKNAVDFLTSAVKDVDEVREKSLAEVIEKTQAAYKKMSVWSNKVPDFQEDEAEFLKFAKANMAKGGALAQKLEKCIEECEKACTEWQCTATLDMDEVTAPAGEELRAMRAAVTIYTGLCLANQVLKLKRKAKQDLEQQQKTAAAEQQGQINMQSQQMAAQTAMQKIQMETQATMQIEEAKAQFSVKRMQGEAAIKAELHPLY